MIRRPSLNYIVLACAFWSACECVLAEASKEGIVAGSQANDAQEETNWLSSLALTLTSSVTIAAPAGVPQTIAELKQEVQVAIDTSDYQRALQYALLGLRINPADFELLAARAIALTKLHRFDEAIAAHEDALSIQPDNVSAVTSLAELLLITGRVQKYRSFADKHKLQIDTANGGMLAKYFSVLEAYQTKGDDQFRSFMLHTLASLPTKTGPLLRGWEFGELLTVISQQPSSPKTVILRTFIRVLKGEVSRDEAAKTINESPQS